MKTIRFKSTSPYSGNPCTIFVPIVNVLRVFVTSGENGVIVNNGGAESHIVYRLTNEELASVLNQMEAPTA